MKYKTGKSKYILILSFVILFFLPSALSARGTKKEGKRVMAKTSASQIKTAAMDINNINALQENNGFSDFNPNSNLEGTVFPKGTGKNIVFEGGFLWGGFVPGDPQVRVGGSAYISGLQPGPIMANGQPADPTDPAYQIYRVRPDVYPGGPSVDLSGDAAAENYWNPSAPLSADQVRLQYEHDWTDWPAKGNPNAPDLGAPFQDVNHDGKYEPNIDIPGVPGADQTIYYVANDQDTNSTISLYGTLPLGLEVHVTMWAYSQAGALGDMYFKKWDIINKGFQKNTIDSMFVSYWTDVDLGNASDDLVGCDSALSLQYAYNGEPTDQVYAPLPPPSIGFDFFEGPTVPGSPTDSAIFEGQVLHGYKNLPMYSAYTFTNPGGGYAANFNDPTQGSAVGSTEFYDFFRGLDRNGAPIIDPITGKPSRFIFSGNPVTRTGWIDGGSMSPFMPPRDIRQGMSSGPFTMAPGDTQEVVVGEICAGAVPSVNYLQAISLMEVYDQTAQSAFNHFFNLPSAPAPPLVQATALKDKIILNWGYNADRVKKTETTVINDALDGGAYKFEGYNVYQLPYFGASVDQAKKIATYDVIDNVTVIPFTDPVTRTVEPSISIESGTDSGIQRYFVDSTDVFNGNKAFNDGTPYYFAVTAYSYNPVGVPQSLENPISIVTVTPQAPSPGVTETSQGDISASSVKHSGTANASVSVNVVDPTKVTGDQYQISFHQEKYALGLDKNGNPVWTDITSPSKNLGKVTDLTGSYLSSAVEYSEQKSALDIHFTVHVISPNYDFCDGVKMVFPAGVTIDTADEPVSNNTGSPIPYTWNKATNTLFYSTLNPDSLMGTDTTYRSQDGVFAGGEDIIVRVSPSTLPIQVKYTMYDDNWGDNNGYYGGLVDVSGVDTVTGPIAQKIITQNQWDVKDITTGSIVLKNQTILDGVDPYAPSAYYATHFFNGPGGSSGSPVPAVGTSANAIFDGLQASVNGSYNAPTTIDPPSGQVILNGSNVSYSSANGYEAAGFEVWDFTVFGFSDGTAAGSLPSYNGNVPVGVPLTDINDLQQDYELKWNGVEGDTTINGHTVVITKSGGQMATIFGASNYKFADHPLNPNPGSTNPFTIRIPFQVWNTTKNEQVNLLVYDRNYNGLNDPTKDGFQVWNTRDRMYVWVVNTKYTTDVVSPTGTAAKDSATWNWVFFTSKFNTGDDMKIIYSNPLQNGKDTFTFTVPKPTYSVDKARVDVTKINVFPNPYYGVNYLETSKYQRFVTFNHLPTKATIRIFNLAGVEVKVINHNGGNFEQWNLENESNLPVASGLYIAYIDMPNIGQTKILKFAIIQEQQVPDHF